MNTTCAEIPVDNDVPVDELKTYREYVQRIANGPKPSEVILNRSPAHAAVVIEALFGQAHHDVSILTECLNPAVYGVDVVIDAAKNFLRQNPAAKIEILSEKEIDCCCHPFVGALKDADLCSRVSLRQLREDISSNLKFHFAVADGLHFRFEADKTSTEAMVQFGEPELGGHMEKTFSRLKSFVSPNLA